MGHMTEIQFREHRQFGDLQPVSRPEAVADQAGLALVDHLGVLELHRVRQPLRQGEGEGEPVVPRRQRGCLASGHCGGGGGER